MSLYLIIDRIVLGVIICGYFLNNLKKEKENIFKQPEKFRLTDKKKDNLSVVIFNFNLIFNRNAKFSVVIFYLIFNRNAKFSVVIFNFNLIFNRNAKISVVIF